MVKTRVARESVVRMPNAIGGLDSMVKLISETGARR